MEIRRKKALYNLKDDIKKEIIPLIEVVSLGNGLEMTYWENKLFYLYIYDDLYNDDVTEFNKIIAKYDKKYIIPVISDTNTDDIINSSISKSSNGIALRIKKSEFPNINSIINRILNLSKNTEIDLILDLLDISDTDISRKNLSYLSNIINEIYNLIKIRRLIIASTSIPNSMSGYTQYKILELERYEIKLFDALSKITNSKLIFSDYCTRYHEYIDYKHFVHKYFNIKYTIPNKYLLLKGDLDGDGYKKENIAPLCNLLVTDSRYCGKDYSFGDNYIYNRTTINPALGYGNPTNWITNCINHHITFIVKSI